MPSVFSKRRVQISGRGEGWELYRQPVEVDFANVSEGQKGLILMYYRQRVKENDRCERRGCGSEEDEENKVSRTREQKTLVPQSSSNNILTTSDPSRSH